MKRTWKYLRLFAITGLVGFGICWGFQLITTVHGLVGESDQSLYNTRIRQGYIIGLCAAGLWLYRRLRDLRLRWWERAEFAFATFFIAYLAYWITSGEIDSFLAFTPDDAARRDAITSPARKYLERGSIVFQDSQHPILHDSLDNVREYIVKDETGKRVWVIGVYPHFFWWCGKYSQAFYEL